MNALLNYKGDNKDLIGATCYVTLFPCSNCAKFLAQAGIKRVVVPSLNKRDIEELDKEVTKDIEFIYIKEYEELKSIIF